jgi:hypothetical protein
MICCSQPGLTERGLVYIAYTYTSIMFDSDLYNSILRNEATCPSEISLSAHNAMRCHKSDDHNLRTCTLSHDDRSMWFAGEPAGQEPSVGRQPLSLLRVSWDGCKAKLWKHIRYCARVLRYKKSNTQVS